MYVEGVLSVPCSPPPRDIELGDVVVVGQCRPLSKTVRFNVLKVQKAKGGKKQFQKFWTHTISCNSVLYRMYVLINFNTNKQ